MDYSLFEWDNEKNISNKEKHKIGFEEAALVFDDPFHITSVQDKFIRGTPVGKNKKTAVYLLPEGVLQTS